MQKTAQLTIAPLDGLRALAILLVLCCHMAVQSFSFHLVGAGFLLSLSTFGFSGVFLFFVLSGFLLFLPYARALLGTSSWPSVKRFYLRRALRILPVYLVVLLLLLVVRVYLGGFQTTPQALALMPVLLFDVSPDAAHLVQWINPAFWTLTVEWQFYLLLPWIALGLAKCAGRRTGRSLFLRLAYGLGFLIVSGLALRVLAAIAHYTSGQDDPVAAPGFLGALVTICFGARGKQLDVFTLGISASLFYVWAIEQGHLPRASQRLIGQLTLVLSSLGVAASCWWASLVGRVPNLTTTYLPHGQVWAVLGEWTLGVCFDLLLLAVLFGPSWLGSLFSLRPLRAMGTISYSLYVWHWPLLLLCLTALVPLTHGTFGPPVVIASLVIFTIGSASYWWIERPFLPWRYVPRSLTPAQVLASRDAASLVRSPAPPSAQVTRTPPRG